MSAEMDSRGKRMYYVEKLKMLATWVCLLSLLAFLFYIVDTSFGKIEQSFCYEWQEQATELRDYYISPSQSAMCEPYGIHIDAIIK